MARAEAKYTIRAEDKTAPGLRSAETRLQRLQRSAINFGRRFASAIGAGAAAITGIVVGLRRIVGGLDDTAKAAADFGLQASELEQYRVTAKLLGTDLNTLLRIQERLANASSEAADGVAEYADEFERLNIDAQAFSRLSFRGQLAALDIGLRGLGRTEAIAARRQLAGRGTGRVFRGNLRETLGAADEILDVAGLNAAASAAERFTDNLTLLVESLAQQAAAATTRPIAEALGSEPVIGAINILTDAVNRSSSTRGIVRLEDAQIDQLERIVSSGGRYRR